MRVLLSCLQSLERHPIPAYGYWRHYFTKGLAEAGIDSVEIPDVDWAAGVACPPGYALNEWRANTWDKVLCFVKREHSRTPLDLFLSYFYPQQIEVAAIFEIQRMGIPCVNFFCDNVREFQTVPPEYYCFDLHWVPEFEAIDMYRKAGLRHLDAPMPVWVDPSLRLSEQLENYGVTFIGSRDALREKLLADALKLGGNIEIRGSGWINAEIDENPKPKRVSTLVANQFEMVKDLGLKALLHKIDYRCRPAISDKVFAHSLAPSPADGHYATVTQQSMITLGINRYPSFRHSFSRPGTYSRLRDIEAPMMGACYLTEWTKGLEHLYALGEEIETYRTSDEMVVKIQELKSDRSKRLKLRRLGQRRALSDHTVPRTLSKITAELGLSNGSTLPILHT